jgi:hypothetical protein
MLHMLHVLRSPTESCAVEVGRSRLENGDVAYGSSTDLTAPKFDFRSSPESGLKSDIEPCPVRANNGSRVFTSCQKKPPKGGCSTLMIADQANAAFDCDARAPKRLVQQNIKSLPL